MPPNPYLSPPVYASFPSEKLTIGAGVAIFHIASQRVVVCYHTRDKYYFLPKGRRNANESTTAAAEREGFEESGYRNRVLPLPFQHRQPQPDGVVRGGEGYQRFVTEPIWTQLLPLSATSQYMLFWYAAETVPSGVERQYSSNARLYQPPPAFPESTTIKQRIGEDEVEKDGKQTIYEPLWHEGTGVDEEEAQYKSYLLPIEEARQKLKGSVMEDVIKRAWEAVAYMSCIPLTTLTAMSFKFWKRRKQGV